MYTQVWDARTNAPSERAVHRDADSASIPFDPGNVDYQAYLAWLEEGNEPNPARRPPLDQVAQLAARTEFRARTLERRGQYLQALALRQGLRWPPPSSIGA